MAMQVNPDTGEVGVKQRYRVTNRSEYDRALVNRGNLTIWFDDESLRDSWTPPPPVGRGTPGRYSEIALQTCLTIKGLFQLPYRATEGLVRLLMRKPPAAPSGVFMRALPTGPSATRLMAARQSRVARPAGCGATGPA